MGDWDDEDFEVDVKQVEEKLNIVEDVVETVSKSAPLPTVPASSKKKVEKEQIKTVPADLERDLTDKEKERLQRRGDFRLARELFGDFSNELIPYAELRTTEDFRSFGEHIGTMLISRANATNFIDMLSTLLKTVVQPMDAVKVRHLSTMLKSIADEKTAAEKRAKAKGAAAKPTMKLSQKTAVPSKANKELYDDYVDDEYDDYADHFM